MIPEQIPTWFYVLLVAAIGLSLVSVLIGPKTGSHAERSVVGTMLGVVVCLIGLAAATLWWRGVLFDVITRLT